MKEKNSIIWITALFLSGTLALQAQELPKPAKPGKSAPPRVEDGPRPPRRPGDKDRPGANKPLVKLSTIKGTVIRPIANDQFEYNGLLIKTSNGEVNVKFPPHLGETIISKAKNGSNVTIVGDENTERQGQKVFQLQSIEVNGTLISDTPPVAPATPVAPEQKILNSTIDALNYDINNKNIKGFTLSSGERINIPPHVAQQLVNQLKKGEKVQVTGFVEPKRPGVMYSQNISSVRAQTLNINGQTYLVK